MSSAPGPRPREVTIGGWAAAIASAILVVTVFDKMTELRSVDTREALTRALDSGYWRDLGITVDDAIATVQGALFVAGAAAGVTAVLGVFVLQRHTGARIALTLAAVPVVLTSPFSGGLLGIVVGGATGLLWTRPARDWFAGRPPTAPPPERAATARPAAESRIEHVAPLPAPEVRPGPDRPALPAPPPTPGWGQVPTPSAAWPPPHAAAAAVDARVPGPVRVACLLTWILSGLTAATYTLVVVAVAVDRNAVLDAVRDNPALRDSSLSDNELIGFLVAISALVIVWCIVASVLAALTVRRQRTAWILLLVCVAVAAVVEVLAIPFSLLHLAACVATFVLLLRPGVSDWFRQGGPPVGRVQDGHGWPPPTGAPLPPPKEPAPPPGSTPPDRPTGKPPVW